jgi:hypothetical protein
VPKPEGKAKADIGQAATEPCGSFGKVDLRDELSLVFPIYFSMLLRFKTSDFSNGLQGRMQRGKTGVGGAQESGFPMRWPLKIMKLCLAALGPSV